MAFTYSNLKSDLETQLGNHFNSLVNPQRAINNAVRELALEMDLRTTIRHSQGCKWHTMIYIDILHRQILRVRI